jgi:hypothetical protein
MLPGNIPFADRMIVSVEDDDTSTEIIEQFVDSEKGIPSDITSIEPLVDISRPEERIMGKLAPRSVN